MMRIIDMLIPSFIRRPLGFATLLAVFAFLPLSVHAATIFMKDGSTVSGTIVSATANDVQIYTGDGTRRIDTGKISRIDYQMDAPPARTEPVYSEPQPRRVYPEPEELHESSLNQMFTFGLGFATPLTEVDFSEVGGGKADNGDSGILLGTQYFYFPQPRFAWGFDLEYFNRSINDSQSLLPQSDTEVSGDTLLMMGLARYTFTPRGVVRPYGVAGLGLNRTSTEIRSTPQPGFEWSDTATGETRTLFDDSKWGLAYTLRVGLDFNAMAPGMFSVELGWLHMLNRRIDPTPAGRDLGFTDLNGRLGALMLAARWSWRF